MDFPVSLFANMGRGRFFLAELEWSVDDWIIRMFASIVCTRKRRRLRWLAFAFKHATAIEASQYDALRYHLLKFALTLTKNVVIPREGLNEDMITMFLIFRRNKIVKAEFR